MERRAFTPGEAAGLAAQDSMVGQDGTSQTIRQQASQALATNRVNVALASPTDAQTTAQVKAVTRQ